CLQGYTTPWTF
nr:immunoglobulin light chain junction region [Macaca mulatta]MOX24914.1 immunoglobulin light chain junction region [Macaca mulatta]MOX98879.1 immunoglobulin light chain junction region [Macaca mulatta]NSL97389.1 immunoglobulin light chain junction region [Mus musculus]